MLIRDLFTSDVTRDIPPVVYFHEQSPEKLAAEVSEYIITGGWPEDHPNHRRVPNGIHEEYVRLLTNVAAELDKTGGPELPNVWISGFYGSGKSSFAKLLGLSLNGVALPSGVSLQEAWLRQDTSPRSPELRQAWQALRQRIDPLAVVFDIGAMARENEHVHSVAVRQVQRRLGYCTEPHVADFELRLEIDGEWDRFVDAARETLGAPWAEQRDKALAEEDFSHVMHVMHPERYSDPMSWYVSRAGTPVGVESPNEAVAAIRNMIGFRHPGATLFLVVDEVSQYVLANQDRVDRLRAFASALGSTLRGKAWLMALGQQKLDEDAGDPFLVWAKDRFPPKLRVHLAATNIQDVVHKRLLQKRPEAGEQLRELFTRHRPDLKLYAYGCESATPEEFAEIYPMLPRQIDLILQITSALRTRSTRAQGDDQAIRGLLQLLGELFRDRRLADEPVGSLVTLDQIYDVQHTALDSDVQDSMARVLNQCSAEADRLLVRAAKAVALLELIQDIQATDAKLVAQCLYDRVDRGNNVAAVTEALDELRRRNLLGYSEKQGYKIQSTAGEEWDRERRDIGVARETISEIVQEGLKFLLATPEQPRLHGRPFPWAGQFSDGRRADDISLASPRDDAVIRVDLRFLGDGEQTESTWVKRSAETALLDRLIWLCGDGEVDDLARDLQRSRAMVKRYRPRRESLNPARRMLLQQEENRVEDLEKLVRDAIAAAWMAGRMYFRGRSFSPQDHGMSFASALHSAATRVLPDLFPHFVATQVPPSELLQLVGAELSGLSAKFLLGELGILELDSGRYVPACSGVVPRRVQDYIESEDGLGGAALLAHFGSPPYGYTANVVKACVAGLLRAGKVRLQPDSGDEITAVRDVGVRDLFERDRDFRRAMILPAGQDDIGPQARARIGRFFKDRLEHDVDREDHAIADAASQYFPQLAQRVRAVQSRLRQLPGSPEGPAVFVELSDLFERCMRTVRQTKPTVTLIKKGLDTLQDGVALLRDYDAELTPDRVCAVVDAQAVYDYQIAQLQRLDGATTNVATAAARVADQLGSGKPWVDITTIDPDLDEIRNAYVAERTQLLQQQEQQAEAARTRLKAREGFSTLTADQSHHVLRPITEAVTTTTAEAIAPALDVLRVPFQLALERAEERANEHLDTILSEGAKPLITPVDLKLRHREVMTEADVQALVDDIRDRLLEQIRAGTRVRLL